MKKAVKIKKDRIYLWIVAVLILIMLFFLFRAYMHLREFDSHRDYFRQNNVSIESWMGFKFIEKRFGIPPQEISDALGIKDSRQNERETIESLCKKNKLNCTEAVERLNKLIR